MKTPKETNWQERSKVLHYVNGTKIHRMLYSTSNNLKMFGYFTNDFAHTIHDGTN
jgi:hypothetical protein